MPKEGIAMPYCLGCGRLRDTNGGFCLQCRVDKATSDRHKGRTVKRDGMKPEKTEEVQRNGNR